MRRYEIKKRLKAQKNRGLCALVAVRLGISRSAVTQWVKGKTQRSRRIEAAILECLAERNGGAHEQPEQQ